MGRHRTRDAQRHVAFATVAGGTVAGLLGLILAASVVAISSNPGREPCAAGSLGPAAVRPPEPVSVTPAGVPLPPEQLVTRGADERGCHG